MEAVLATIRVPVIVLDRELRIRCASAAFCDAFDVNADDAEGRCIFDLDGRQWDSVALRDLLERILPERTVVEDFEITHELKRRGRRVLRISARRVGLPADSDGFFVLVIEDVSSRRTASAAPPEQITYVGAPLAVAPEAVVTINERGIIDTFNGAAESTFGFAAAEVVGKNVGMLLHDGSDLDKYLSTGNARFAGQVREVTGRTKDGAAIPLRLSVVEQKICNRGGFVGILHDLTREKERHHDMQQFHKLEALGQLAGGIAHDFNNLLTIMIGNQELLEPSLTTDEQRALLSRATGAAEMGASLARRLLSFANRIALEPVILCINDQVFGIMDLLRRTIPETINVEASTAPNLWHSRIDPSELENTLINLVVNARDAMPKGGNVIIETANETVDFASAGARAGLTPGDYVRVSVIDTGTGMRPEVLKRATEPFFTTKLNGHGTGLGLTTAHRFARRSGGALTIISELGKGTTVNLYLPRAETTPAAVLEAVDSAQIPLAACRTEFFGGRRRPRPCVLTLR